MTDPHDESLDKGPHNIRGRGKRIVIGGLTFPTSGINDDDVEAQIRRLLILAADPSDLERVRKEILEACRTMRELHQIVMTDARQEAVYRNKRQLERLQQERGLLPTRKRMTTDLPQPILKGSDKEVRAHRPKHTPKPQERQVIRDLTGSGHGTSVKHVLPPGLAEQFTAEEVHELSKASLRKERRRKKESRGDDES